MMIGMKINKKWFWLVLVILVLVVFLSPLLGFLLDNAEVLFNFLLVLMFVIFPVIGGLIGFRTVRSSLSKLGFNVGTDLRWFYLRVNVITFYPLAFLSLKIGHSLSVLLILVLALLVKSVIEFFLLKLWLKEKYSDCFLNGGVSDKDLILMSIIINFILGVIVYFVMVFLLTFLMVGFFYGLRGLN
jgi:hypothetical protein